MSEPVANCFEGELVWLPCCHIFLKWWKGTAIGLSSFVTYVWAKTAFEGELWALLVSVTVRSTQVATFFLLSSLGLVHSVPDTTCLPSAYARFVAASGMSIGWGFFLSEWA